MGSYDNASSVYGRIVRKKRVGWLGPGESKNSNMSLVPTVFVKKVSQ